MGCLAVGIRAVGCGVLRSGSCGRRRPGAAAERTRARTRDRRRGSNGGMNLDGKCVVVTGGAGGIGEALATRFRGEGARAVTVADRQADLLEATAARIGASGRVCDVTDP